MKSFPKRALVAALAVLLLPLAFAGSAHAFALERVEPVPRAPSQGGDLPRSGASASGAHPDMAITMSFSDAGDSGADSVQALRLDLAPGIVSFIRNVPECTSFTQRDDDDTDCDRSQVGETSTTASTSLLPIPLTLRGQIYRIPSPDPSRYPAALGIDIDPPPLTGLVMRRIKLISPITVDPKTLGLTATLSGLPNDAVDGIVRVHIDRITQVLYGFTESGRPFYTNPTSCIDAPITVTATSHGGATSAATGSYRPTDCENAPFNIAFATGAEPATPDSTSAISFNVQPGAGTPERESAHVRSTTVIAAPGILLNSALAAGLEACTDAGFRQDDTSVEANCPASSKVGTIQFVSPVLGPFPGTVYFGTQTPTDRLRLFLDVPLFGAHIKVSARVNPDRRTGQVTTVFSDLPQIAFTEFRLTFNGGARSALVTPVACGPATSTAIAGPWSGGAEKRADSAFDVRGEPGACDRRFTPSMGTAVANPQAGAETAFTLSFDRPDRTVPIGRVAFDLPPGLIGSLALRGLTKCALTAAATASCPESSRIGSVASVVGSGTEPPTLNGSIYLTEPKVAGDPAGLSIHVPARLGPVDAGNVIVGQRLVLGGDGGLDVISDDIPALQEGIPLAIRRLIVNIDRRGFMRNPTSCGDRPASGAFAPLDGGAGATAGSAIRVTGCDRLPFAPVVRGIISGRASLRENAHPQFTTVITQRSGQAAMRSAVVTLPRSIAANLQTVGKACEPAVYAADASRCDPIARVATARAVSPLVSRPLTGTTYLIRQPRGLPKLAVQLRGEVSLDLEGIVTLNRANQLVTTFGAIPDLELSSFTLAFRGGRHGILTTVGNLCRLRTMTAALASHSGRSLGRKPKMTVPSSCARPKASASLRFRGDSGTLTVKASAPKGVKPLRSLRVGLPKGLALGDATIAAKAGKKRLGSKAVKARGRTLTVRLPRRGARSVALTLRGVDATSRRLARRLSARRGTLRVSVKVGTTDKRSAGAKLRLKLR